MKHRIIFNNVIGIWVIIICLLGLPFLKGCGCPPDGSLKEFNLTIVVSDKLGDRKNDKLPKSIIELCLPIECPQKNNLISKPIIHRLGFDHKYDLQLETQIGGDFAGNQNNIRYITRKITAHLSEVEIGEAFAKVADPLTNKSADFNLIIQSIGRHSSAIILADDLQDVYNGVRILSSLDSLRMWIVKEIFENNRPSIVVFIDPPLKDQSPSLLGNWKGEFKLSSSNQLPWELEIQIESQEGCDLSGRIRRRIGQSSASSSFKGKIGFDDSLVLNENAGIFRGRINADQQTIWGNWRDRANLTKYDFRIIRSRE